MLLGCSAILGFQERFRSYLCGLRSDRGLRFVMTEVVKLWIAKVSLRMKMERTLRQQFAHTCKSIIL